MNISDYINNLIIEANRLLVSDIHFNPNEEYTKIYFRYNNSLKLQKEIDIETYNKLLRYIKYKSKLDISLTREPQDGRFVLQDNKDNISMRVSTIPLLENESLVIRLLNEQNHTSMEELSYYQEDLLNMYKTIKSKNGLFIFTGPTGSGKSTSMYSILNSLAINDNLKIVCIENPVEVINNNFIQININEDIGLTYATALKASLRQDPDIIMIGEIRDEETAKNVFRAALTGHTVISTMHTKNKYGVIERFKDFGFSNSEIHSILIGISNQRIIKSNNTFKALFDYVLEDDIEKLGPNEVSIEQKLKEII
ncbi:MAG: competence type IV pilus ATPase ComGA [Mycoplasmatales bacterium]